MTKDFASPSYRYSVFGLQVESTLPLPELVRGDTSKRPDVVIELGLIPLEPLPESGVRSVDGGAIIQIDGAARFLITGGNFIRVEAAAQADDRDVRVFLLGSALGMLIHQRQLVPLHANSVDVAGKAIAFVGASGAGKSTLAAWFHAQGYALLGDDVCVVGFDEKDHPIAYPGLPRMRLWRTEVLAQGLDPTRFERSFASAEAPDKLDVPTVKTGRTNPLPLGAIFAFDVGPALHMSRLPPSEAAGTIFEHTYRGGYLNHAGGEKHLWQSAIKIVSKVPVYLLGRTKDRSKFEAEAIVIRDFITDNIVSRGLDTSA